jgi:hypothetical protein
VYTPKLRAKGKDKAGDEGPEEIRWHALNNEVLTTAKLVQMYENLN